MTSLEATRLKERMAKITAKWRGKEHDDIVPHCKWRADMMIYRNLKRKLKKLGVVGGLFNDV